jgi:hypothetical protein
MSIRFAESILLVESKVKRRVCTLLMIASDRTGHYCVEVVGRWSELALRVLTKQFLFKCSELEVAQQVIDEIHGRGGRFLRRLDLEQLLGMPHERNMGGRRSRNSQRKGKAGPSRQRTIYVARVGVTSQRTARLASKRIRPH